jgi:hypothetical protein
MRGIRWTRVDATIVECFRAWEEPPGSVHPWFEVVADIKTSAGGVERVSCQQKLSTRTHHWRAPDPGDVVAAKWDRAHGRLQLDLGGDPRFDERLIRARGRTRPVPPGPPGIGGGPS